MVHEFSVTCILIRRGGDETQRAEHHVKTQKCREKMATRQRWELCCHKLRNAQAEEASKYVSSPEASEGVWLVDTLISDFKSPEL